MTVTITIPPEIETRLKGEASRNGFDVDTYATKLIADHFPAQDATESEKEEGEDEFRLRGVIPVNYERPVIFTQDLTFRVEDLPKWKPQIILSRRVLAEDDDV